MGYLRVAHLAPAPLEDDNACIEAFDRELEYIFETFRRLGAVPREVEDLAQDLFVVLHRNWPRLDSTRPLRPYLFGVAFRIVCAHRRRRGREIPSPNLDTREAETTPESALQSKESIALLTTALQGVPLPRRVVLVMHELDGVPIAEVAHRLSISRFGAYARLRKAHKELTVAVQRLLGERRRR